jgi:hypothetical protein
VGPFVIGFVPTAQQTEQLYPNWNRAGIVPSSSWHDLSGSWGYQLLNMTTILLDDTDRLKTNPNVNL